MEEGCLIVLRHVKSLRYQLRGKTDQNKKRSSYFSPAGGGEAAAADRTFHQVSLFPIINKESKEREGQPCGLHNECVWVCTLFQRQDILR